MSKARTERYRPDTPWRKGTDVRLCDHDGCIQPGDFRAPRGPGELKSYYWFCLDHVRDYNAKWNYYAGYSEEELEAQIQYDTIWQRPTWRLGGRSRSTYRPEAADLRDFFGLFGADAVDGGPPPEPPVTPEERRALRTLDIAAPANFAEIKAQYKVLVKKYHPDANGGDKAAEEKLKSIIEAYATLKTTMQA